MFKEMNDTSMSLARKTARTGHLIHRFYQASASCAGGDPLRGQGRVLALLAAKPETTQRELSYVLDMRPQSLSELLAKLEDKGYVVREKSAEDGRVTVVRLTEEGAAAAPALDAPAEIPDALECLSDEERASLEAIVDKLSASLEGKLEELGVDPRAHRLHRGPHGPHRGPHREPAPADEGPHRLHRGPHRPLEGGAPLRQA